MQRTGWVSLQPLVSLIRDTHEEDKQIMEIAKDELEITDAESW